MVLLVESVVVYSDISEGTSPSECIITQFLNQLLDLRVRPASIGLHDDTDCLTRFLWGCVLEHEVPRSVPLDIKFDDVVVVLSATVTGQDVVPIVPLVLASHHRATGRLSMLMRAIHSS